MNVTALIAEHKQFLAYELDSFQGVNLSDITDAEVVTLLNRAQDSISLMLQPEFHAEAVTYTTGQPWVNLDDATAHRLQNVRSVRVGTHELRDFRGQPGLYSGQEMDAISPGWRTGTSTAATPRAACQIDRLLYFYPKPEAALTITAAGTGMYVVLSDTTPNQIPEAPDELHPAIAAISVIIAAEPQLTIESQVARLARYDARSAGILQARLSAKPMFEVAR